MADSNADSTKMTPMTAPPTAAATAPADSGMDIIEINHKVKNYAVWKKAFDLDSNARKASGLEFITIGREMTDPNNVQVVLHVTDMQKAKAFAADPRLKQVMDKNGVISKPEVDYYHLLRFNPDSKEKSWVIVTHHVKDFNAWEKVFDSEGAATRAKAGMVDVVLARNLADSNTVQLVFDITDMNKAKSDIASPGKKKLMTDAGVEGSPKIIYYKQGD